MEELKSAPPKKIKYFKKKIAHFKKEAEYFKKEVEHNKKVIKSLVILCHENLKMPVQQISDLAGRPIQEYYF